MSESAAEPGTPPVLEELLRLAGAVGQSVQQWAATSLPPAAHGPGATCDWCPLCQAVAMLRGDRPDLTARLAEAGTALMAATRSLVDALQTPADASGPPTEPGGAATEPRPPRVQPIDLGGGPDGGADAP